MTRVLVVWEDEYYDGLERLVRRRLPALAPDPAAVAPFVAFHTSCGNSKFERYVASTWPRARRAGVPRAPGPIDHLVCVVDADKLRDLMPSLPARPVDRAQVPAWHAQLDAAWQQKLRTWVDPSVPASCVHGLVLRWSRESVLLAAFDRQPMRELLGFDSEHPDVQKYLAIDCVPSPLSLTSSGAFTDAFFHPYGCLERAFAKQGLTLPRKNDTTMDDVLRALAKDREHTQAVCTRVPDLDALVKLLWAVSAS